MPDTAAGGPLLAAKSLSLHRAGRELFAGLSFVVEEGELWQIAGDNGTGKTSLLRILCGLSRYGFAGEVERRVPQLYVGHHSAVKAMLTPRENLAWHVSGSFCAGTAGIDEALSAVGLYGYEDVPSHMLSAGQHRRVNLARLYLSDAPMWLLDEPFTAIDRNGVAALEALLDRHVSAGGAVIMTSHQPVMVSTPLKTLMLGSGSAA